MRQMSANQTAGRWVRMRPFPALTTFRANLFLFLEEKIARPSRFFRRGGGKSCLGADIPRAGADRADEFCPAALDASEESHGVAPPATFRTLNNL